MPIIETLEHGEAPTGLLSLPLSRGLTQIRTTPEPRLRVVVGTDGEVKMEVAL